MIIIIFFFIVLIANYSPGAGAVTSLCYAELFPNESRGLGMSRPRSVTCLVSALIHLQFHLDSSTVLANSQEFSLLEHGRSLFNFADRVWSFFPWQCPSPYLNAVEDNAGEQLDMTDSMVIKAA